MRTEGFILGILHFRCSPIGVPVTRPHHWTVQMSMYHSSIALAVPEADPAEYPEIEEIMRADILHSELDWVPDDLFYETARLAYEVVLAARMQPAGGAKTLRGVPGEQ